MKNGTDQTSMVSSSTTSAEDARGILATESANPAKLEDLRRQILQSIGGGDVSAIALLFPAYGATLTSLAESVPTPDRLRELESSHALFFEQLRVLLIASRIETRLELERVRASRQYTAHPAEGAPGEKWQG